MTHISPASVAYEIQVGTLLALLPHCCCLRTAGPRLLLGTEAVVTPSSIDPFCFSPTLHLNCMTTFSLLSCTSGAECRPQSKASCTLPLLRDSEMALALKTIQG